MKKIQTTFIKIFKAVAGKRGGTSLVEWSLIALVVLLPLLIVPQFTDIHGTVKQILLIVLSSLAFFGWTLHAYRNRTLTWNGGIVTWFPLVLLVVVGVSAGLSSSRFSTWIGLSGQTFTSFVPFLAMLIVYMLAMQLGKNKKTLRKLSCALLFSTLLLLIYGVLEFFGVSFLSGANGFKGFSLSGTFESMVIIGVLVTLLFSGMWVVADKTENDTWMPTKRWQITFMVLGVSVTALTLFFMIVNDRWPSEIILLAGSGFIVALGLFDPRKFRSPSRLLFPIGLFTLSLLLILFRSPISSPVPVEIAPNYSASWEISVDTLNADGVFGSGPGTWRYDFTRFKPETFSKTNFWQATFDHSGTSMLTLFATWGLVPMLVFLTLIIWIFVRIFDTLVLRRAREEWQTIAVLSSVWLAFVVSKFVYSSDIVLETFFWLLTGLLVAHVTKGAKRINFDKFARTSLVTSFAIVISGVAFVFALTVSTQWVMGEVSIARAVSIQNSEEVNLDGVVIEVARAVKFNKWNADYRRTLAVAHLNRVNELAKDVEGNAQLIVQGADLAERMAKDAIILEPFDVRGYELLGGIYSSLSAVIGGSDAIALDQYRLAVKLDPSNPLQYVRLARGLVDSVDRLENLIDDEEKRDEVKTQMLAEAEEVIDIAVGLRPNYAPTFYARTLILERQGRLDDAINQLLPIVANSPQDPVIRFELGVLQLRAGNKDRALQDFQVAVELVPTYANARWYLVALYEEMGDIDAAISQLEALNTLNPDDQVVLDKMSLLRQGQETPQAPENVEPLEDVEILPE